MTLDSPPSPNPSSSSIRLEFRLPAAASADLSVYDVSGRWVATLLHAELPAGRKSVTWNGHQASGRRVAAGLYFARLVTPQGSAVGPIIRID